MTDQANGEGLSPADEQLLSLDDQPAEQPTEQPKDDEIPGDDGAAETVEGGEGQDQAEKPRKTAQDRIDEVTKARREAERERDHWREMAMRGQPKPEPSRQQSQTDDEPDPGDTDRYQFGETDPAYIKDLGAWAARQQFAALAKQQAATNEARTVQQADQDRQAKFSKDNPDFHDVVYSSQWACTDEMAAAIQSSDDGPAVAYHLAKNPTEARRIASLPPIAQVRELGRLEAQLVKPADPQPTPRQHSNAPAPFPQVRGGQGRFAIDPEKSSFEDFEKMADKALAKRK